MYHAPSSGDSPGLLPSSFTGILNQSQISFPMGIFALVCDLVISSYNEWVSEDRKLLVTHGFGAQNDEDSFCTALDATLRHWVSWEEEAHNRQWSMADTNW